MCIETDVEPREVQKLEEKNLHLYFDFFLHLEPRDETCRAESNKETDNCRFYLGIIAFLISKYHFCIEDTFENYNFVFHIFVCT